MGNPRDLPHLNPPTEPSQSLKESVSSNGSEPETKTNPSHLPAASAHEVFDGKSERDQGVSDVTGPIRLTRDCLRRVLGMIIEDGGEDEVEVYKLGLAVEARMVKYEEERREMENAIVSLTEENRDMMSLLRAAVAEKEAAESKLKGSGEQRRGMIMQIAERGLQRVGFLVGAMGGEVQSDQAGSSSGSTRAEGSECEEEVDSLTLTVEKIMKNLRFQITDLKRSLEETRSECENLQSLVDKQAQKIIDSVVYIKDLEEKEGALTHNVEQLLKELRDAGEEVARWREACELEVEAGKSAVEDLEKEVAMLKKELAGTKSTLDESNTKLKSKEKLAAAAMAAHEAAETSLRLADIRSATFRERIEELTRLVEVEEEGERGKKERTGVRRRVRHMCWPWQGLTVGSLVRNRRRRSLPELEALLHFRI